MPEKLKITELDFESIKSNLKDFLRNQNTFKDYDFEGSGLSVLIDLLAYNTHYNAYYMNMVANEMFLDTAIVRDSVLSHAKALNYTPSSARAATAIVDVVVTPPGGNTQSALTLQRFHPFQSESVDGVNYTFTTTEAKTVLKENGVFTFSSIELKQGTPQTYRQTYNDVTNPKHEFTLPDSSIDTTTLQILVQESSTNITSKVFTLSSDATVANSTSQVFFLDTTTNNQYKIRFGDGTIGTALSNGNIVISSYLATDGDVANYANSFSTGTIAGFSTVLVTPISAASGGASQEDLTSIKYRAPLAYTSQNRMVTPLDYETIIRNKYPAFQSLAVWGGEQQDPPVYGKVFLSYLLRENVVINETEKQRILNEIVIPNSMITVTPQFIDPDFVYLLFEVFIDYTNKVTTQTAGEIEALSRTAIQTYMGSEFNKFGGVLVPSRLERTVDDVSPAIIGNNIMIRLQKRFTPLLNTLKTYTIDFGFPIHRGGLTDILTSTGFYIFDSTETQRLAFIDEEPNSFTGVDDILIDNPGFGYIETPTIIITGDGVGATAQATIVNGQITKIELLSRGQGYTRALVLIEGGGGSGATATAVIVARYGTLRTFYYNDLAQKVIINANAGTIDHNLGRLTLPNLKIISVDAPDGLIRINAESEEGVLTATKNQILRLDTTDSTALQITAVL